MTEHTTKTTKRHHGLKDHWAATVHLIVEAPSKNDAEQAILDAIVTLMRARKIVSYGFAGGQPHKEKVTKIKSIRRTRTDRSYLQQKPRKKPEVTTNRRSEGMTDKTQTTWLEQQTGRMI